MKENSSWQTFRPDEKIKFHPGPGVRMTTALALALTRFRRPYRPAPPRFLCACIYAAILC